MNEPTPVLAIDPGASGGLAWTDPAGGVHAEPMPPGMTATVDRLRELYLYLPNLTAVVENVGWWHPGDHPNAAAKFARHCGELDAALYAVGIPSLRKPTPQTWMKALGTLPKDKAARKRAIRDLMARHYPHLRVTLQTADALGILTYHLMTQPRKG